MLLRLGGVRSQSATMPVRMQGSCVPSPPSARACVCPRARPRTRAVAGRQARSGAGAPPAEQARAGMPVQWEHLGVQTTAFPVRNGPSTAGLYITDVEHRTQSRSAEARGVGAWIPPALLGVVRFVYRDASLRLRGEVI